MRASSSPSVVTGPWPEYTIVSAGNQMMAGRVYATDTGAAVTEIGLGPVGQGVPTLSHVFMFLLIATLTGAAILMLRRRATAT